MEFYGGNGGKWGKGIEDGCWSGFWRVLGEMEKYKATCFCGIIFFVSDPLPSETKLDIVLTIPKPLFFISHSTSVLPVNALPTLTMTSPHEMTNITNLFPPKKVSKRIIIPLIKTDPSKSNQQAKYEHHSSLEVRTSSGWPRHYNACIITSYSTSATPLPTPCQEHMDMRLRHSSLGELWKEN